MKSYIKNNYQIMIGMIYIVIIMIFTILLTSYSINIFKVLKTNQNIENFLITGIFLLSIPIMTFLLLNKNKKIIMGLLILNFILFTLILSNNLLNKPTKEEWNTTGINITKLSISLIVFSFIFIILSIIQLMPKKINKN